MGKIHIDDELIRHLADLLNETGLSEIEVGTGRDRLRVSRAASINIPSVATTEEKKAISGDVVQDAVNPATTVGEAGAIKAPMVGTVYRAPEPDAKPFISEGENVREGDTLFIIEAMKTMNPVTAPKNGRVRTILAEDGRPVEYDEILALID